MITFDEFKIFKFPAVGSTNDEAFEILKSTGLHPIAVVADEQTKGRGRSGHSWVSQPGGLYLSIGLKSRDLLTDSKLIVFSSLPVIETLTEFGIKAHIKIPNDVYVGEKKIAGILGERKFNFLVIGIGFNINQKSFPKNLKATSMLLETGELYDKNEILYSFLQKFSELLTHADLAYHRWVSYVKVFEKTVRFIYKGTEIQGVVKTIDKDLNLILDNGKFNIYEIFDFREL